MVQVVVRPHPDSSRLVVKETESVVLVDQPQKATVTAGRININKPKSSTVPMATTATATTKPKNRQQRQQQQQRSYQVSLALSPQTTQTQVFQTAVLPLLTQWIVGGHHGAMFAYGFTGTGKSFSLFGTDEKPGSIVLAAHHLLKWLKQQQQQQQQQQDGNADYYDGNDGIDSRRLRQSRKMMLRVSIYEVDGKQVKDLLTDEPLTVRVDEHGSVQIRCKNGSGPITRLTLNTVEEFQSIWTKAQQSRRVGSSTIHDASSRTHAVVDMEIVDTELMRLESIVEEKHANYIKISNDIDDVRKAKAKEAYERDGYTAVVDGVPLTTLLAEIGLPSEEALEVLSKARQDLVDYKTSEDCPPCFRGSFSMIDMAGNDWEQAATVQTKQAKKEHAEINSSLLAVKECFRAMQNKKATYVPYRRSSLTQILKRHFEPTSNCLMLTTIYPKEEEDVTLKQTMNTLTYASSLVKV